MPEPFNPPTNGQLQDKLRALGHYFGKRDEEFGPKTEQAVADYKASRGLGPGPEADQATVEAIMAEQTP